VRAGDYGTRIHARGRRGGVDPILLRSRSGKTAARVIAFGFGGGTLLLGIASFASEALRGARLSGVLVGYGIATLPFFMLAAIVAVCRSELWLVPEARAFRLLTYRPWKLGPLVEEASMSEYAGVRIDPASEDDGGGVLVSLVTANGEPVPVRQFPGPSSAIPFAEQLAEASGLWLRIGAFGAVEGDGPPAP
jgi:hypothetical protein